LAEIRGVVNAAAVWIGAAALFFLPIPKCVICRIVDHDPQWMNADENGDLEYFCARCDKPLSRTVA
jgi:hypothetical protein